MKKFFTPIFLFLTLTLLAQPAQDDCPPYDLGVAPYCDEGVLFNNAGATQTDIGFDNLPTCFIGDPERDVWISFVASDTILDYLITLTGIEDPVNGHPSIVNPQIGVYRGDCEFDGLQQLACASATAGATTLEMALTGLTPGITYYLRINDWSATGTPNSGAFTLCIIKKPPINTIDEGSSTACSGTLTDTGGPDGDYGNNENFAFTICPSQPHECINFTLEYFAIENFSDVLTFYDGPSTSAPVIASLGGSGSGNEANGGVCFAVSASTGCLTIQFQSDFTAVYDGFLGHWECSTDPCTPKQLISVDANATPAEIVESVVSGQTLINITDINCPEGALGVFEAGDFTDLGLNKGLLLTSGLAAEAANPATFFASNGNGTPGDEDLDILSVLGGDISLSNDACILEMDVFAATNELTFEYVFGSEEYPNFVNSSFNDIFAFLASGPGITGIPAIGNQANVATLPDGTFIEINSVNFEQNWQYYRNNLFGQSVAYGGLTSDSLGVKKSLTARIPTIPCNTYHLKFAIADREDSVYDSGVFISEIKSGSPTMTVEYNNGLDFLVEECVDTPNNIVIALDTLVTDSALYTVEIAGTATIGEDYLLGIPGTLVFTPGQLSFNFPIKVLSDGLIEGTETIEVSLIQDFGCGAVVLATLVIELHDKIEVKILNDLVDSVVLCEGGCLLLDVVGAENYFWQPAGVFDDPSLKNPVACPDSSLWIFVTGSIGTCADVDSVYLEVVDPQVQILPDTASLTLCKTDSVTLVALNNTLGQGLTWTSFSYPFTNPTSPIQTIVPANTNANTIFITARVEVGGCIATDNITIFVEPFDFPDVIGDTTICQNFSVKLGTDFQNTSTTFSWTPDIFLSPGGNVPGPVATPEQTTTYTLVAQGPTGACADTATVTVTVLPADIEILNPDTLNMCLGDSLTLNAVNSTNGVGVSWTPQTGMTVISPNEVHVSPPVSTWYYAVLETSECTVLDSVLVHVDSLPDLSITADPPKPSYCQGEQVTLLSTTYEPANFPGIEHSWETPLPGVLTPDSFLNLIFLAVETHVYVRTTQLNACISTDSILITVIPVASIEIIPLLDTICPGESVQFTVIADPAVTAFSWSPPGGLSCTDCKDPVASPMATISYSVEGEFMGCPVGGSANIIVLPLPQVQLPNDRDLCPGESVQLNGTNDPGASYHWTSSDGTLDTTDPTPIVSPAVTTTYFLEAENDNCGLEEEVTILVAEDFHVAVSPDTSICRGNAVQFIATADQPMVFYQWTNAAGQVLSNESSFFVLASQTSTYYLTATDIANPPCFAHFDSVTVIVYDVPQIIGHEFVELNDDTLDLYEGEEFTINISTVPNPIPEGVFDWYLLGQLLATTNDTTSGVLIAPEVDQDVVFTYGVLVTNEFGCEIFEDFTVLVKNNPVAVPNAFTPNTDEFNRTFNLVSIRALDFIEFKVWDRWGKLVYNNDNPLLGWDGRYKGGEEAASDIYVYYIQYKIQGSAAPAKVLKGEVTLLR